MCKRKDKEREGERGREGEEEVVERVSVAWHKVAGQVRLTKCKSQVEMPGLAGALRIRSVCHGK